MIAVIFTDDNGFTIAQSTGGGDPVNQAAGVFVGAPTPYIVTTAAGFATNTPAAQQVFVAGPTTAKATDANGFNGGVSYGQPKPVVKCQMNSPGNGFTTAVSGKAVSGVLPLNLV